MKKEDWPKKQRSERLTPQEIERLRQHYRKETKARDGARDIGCSTRIVNKYYALFAAEGIPKGDEPKRTPRSDRFYRSNFEPS